MRVQPFLVHGYFPRYTNTFANAAAMARFREAALAMPGLTDDETDGY